MAKTKLKSPVIEDVIDDDPDEAPPVESKPKPQPDDFPWGYLVKHPGYGALRVRKDEAGTVDEAIEVYRKIKCPHMKLDTILNSGVRATVTKFVPAQSER